MTLEELINKLIEKGWKPFNVDVKIKRAKCFHSVHFIVRWLVNFVLDGYAEATVPLRELCAKESWLWQFACKNEMANIKYCDRRCYDVDRHLDKACFDNDYEYRIIQSALCDEDKLEEFLLENIKVE